MERSTGVQASDEPAQARRDRTGVKRHRGDTRETQGRAVAVRQEGMPFRSEGAMRKADIAAQALHDVEWIAELADSHYAG